MGLRIYSSFPAIFAQPSFQSYDEEFRAKINLLHRLSLLVQSTSLICTIFGMYGMQKIH